MTQPAIATNLVFWFGTKSTKFVEDGWILLLIKFNWFCEAAAVETFKRPRPIRDRGGYLRFPIGHPPPPPPQPPRCDLAPCHWILFSVCFLSSFIEFCSVVAVKSRMSQQWKALTYILVLRSTPKKTIKLIEGADILLPITFHWILFSSYKEQVGILLLINFRRIPFNGCIGEVENISVNQRPGRPSSFSFRPKNTFKLLKAWS